MILEHSGAVEVDLIRVGCRLRWLGDGTDRLSWRDLWVLVSSWAGDESSAIWRALHPDLYTLAERAGMDAVNGAVLVSHVVAATAGSKTKFEAAYPYPGSPFAPEPPTVLLDAGSRLGGYVKMSMAECDAWLAG